MVLIKAENLIKEYNDIRIIDDVSLEITQGQFLSIVGASGSGKTTLISMLSTFLAASSGTIIIDGIDISLCGNKGIRDLRRHTIGYCYQNSNLIAELSLKQNILLPLSISRMELDKKLFDYLVDMMGLGPHLDKQPKKLSGGEAQRAAIARSIIKKPKVVFLDEPIGNLDSKNGENAIKLLHTLNNDLKTTLVQVTHNISSTACTDIIELKDGKIASVLYRQSNLIT